MMGIPGHAPHLAMAPQPGAGEPDPKRAKADSGLVPEDAFAAQFPGNVTLRVSVPKEEENAKFNFNGQEIALRGVGIRSTVKTVKEMLQDHLGGLQANKQKLTSARHGVLKDNQTLAFYNMREGEMLLLDVKERGGRAVKK